MSVKSCDCLGCSKLHPEHEPLEALGWPGFCTCGQPMTEHGTEVKP